MKILPISSQALKEALSVLRKGGAIAYPTDTVYGLAVDATNAKAVRRLYRIKGRDFKKPVHVIIGRKADIKRFVKVPAAGSRLIRKLFPGPLTLVFQIATRYQKHPAFKLLSPGSSTLGVRMPDHRLALSLARNFGKPITTTSANVSGKPSTYSAKDVVRQFRSRLGPDLILDGGRLRRTKPSTVVDLTDPEHAKVLRKGPISERQIRTYL